MSDKFASRAVSDICKAMIKRRQGDESVKIAGGICTMGYALTTTTPQASTTSAHGEKGAKMGKLNETEIAEIKRLAEAWENCDHSIAITRQLTAKLQEVLKNHFTEADRIIDEEWIVNPMWSADGDRLIGYNYVEELVRCSECKFFRPHSHTYSCVWHISTVYEDGFCSWGERREDGQTQRNRDSRNQEACRSLGEL